MKTLKIKLNATATSYLEYECILEAPDNANADEFVHLLHEAVDGGEFGEADEMSGSWHREGEEWTVVEDGKGEELPRWRFVSGDEGKMERVS